jgi:hypothetical protein
MKQATDRAAPARAARAAKIAAIKAAKTNAPDGVAPAAERRLMKKPAPDDGDSGNDRYAKFRASADTRWQDFSGENRLSIDADTLARLERDGLSLVWVAESCMGQSLDYSISQYVRNGWIPVEPGDIEGIDVTEVDGLQLYCRPAELTRKAKQHEARKARAVVETKRDGLMSGDIPGVTLATRHPSAVRSNRINRTYERIQIPGDSDDGE